ncbi:MAG: BadF/BadG/BcrA/BcrD ATPase family protein [Nakamurella sp.]
MALSNAIFIDAGQSGMKVQLRRDSDCKTGSFPGIRTDLPLLPQLADVVTRVAAQTRAPIDSVTAGVSGLTTAEQNPEKLLRSLSEVGTREVTMAHDSITAFLGTLGYESGVVVAAGTGVVTLAVGAVDVARVDGWGYLMGDAGSGVWLGRAGLDAVMRAHDGRGPGTALTPMVRADYPDLESAYIRLQTDPDRVRRIAAYSRAVTALADDDPVCARICRDGATELAHSASTALTRAGLAPETSPVVCCIGGVFSSARIHEPFSDALRENWPAVDIRSPILDALVGVQRLSQLPADHPLSQWTFRASTAPTTSAGQP